MHKVTIEDFKDLDFGDTRRNNRFVRIVNTISSHPGSSIPRQNKSWYDVKTTYEFFKNEAVRMETLQKAIMDYGVGQLNDQAKLLVLHNISTISYNDLQAQGLGYLDNKHGRGILCYSSIGVSSDGLPVGLLYQHSWVRALDQLGKSSKGKQLTFEAKESYHWKLLTTLEIKTVAEALQCVKWYTYRWLIERFHYVLKSGTKIEQLQLKQANSLQKTIALYSIAAFRIMQLTSYLGRDYPQTNCQLILTPAQWKALYVLIHQDKNIPKKPPDMQQAIRWIGRLGGHLGRKNDGPPGLKTVWRGYQTLCNAAKVYELVT
ncbi:MAG: IS4 family transposase [Bacteroidota bacterium]